MDEGLAFHYVCTHQTARGLARDAGRFWVSNCGCRESRGTCGRSRMDVCLLLREDFPPTGSGFREITWGDVEEILREAREKRLVTRPFRNEEDMAKTDGICFCCDDCCGYFLNPAERCDKGEFIEATDLERCTDCGECAAVCYFGARELGADRLLVNRDACYGCGLCAEVCPEGCIEMRQRVRGVALDRRRGDW